LLIPTLQAAPTILTADRSDKAPTSRSLSIGQLVAGRFRIHGFLGSGGMGEVYEAWDFELSERIALKTIRSQIASLSSVIDRFKQEVREARGISHINGVQGI
jgi:serine/threonine-protein kinase